jgi:DNA-binding NtrC family response regulator
VIPRGKVFLLDDDELIVSMLARALAGEGYEVQAEVDPDGVVEKIRAFGPDVTFLDVRLPGASGLDILSAIGSRGLPTRVVMLTSDDTAETAVAAMKVGAVDYLTKPFDVEQVKALVASLLARGGPVHRVENLDEAGPDPAYGEVVGTSAAVLEVKARAQKLARAGVPLVLITGESGTGKELFARHIHRQMHPAAGDRPVPFLGINCAALPESLIESELFGHEKGSFTDAKAEKRGVFELAAGGSLLLDEIGEMRWNLQAKLLRVLEDRKFRRVGGAQDLPVAATLFATTNRILGEAVKSGEFRIDLYYRLGTFCLHIPPLRDRPEDVLALAEHFLRLFAGRYGKDLRAGFSPEAARLLLAYDWPGNVRELKNVVERIVVLEGGDQVLPEHLPAELRAAPVSEPAPVVKLPEGGVSLDEMEKTLMTQALAKAGGNRAQAAKLLGMTYDSIRYQMKKYGLK